MKKLINFYLVLSLLLIGFLGYHFINCQFNKKIQFVDKSKEELILYFNEICLGTENGTSKKVTRKWKKPINIFIVKKDSSFKKQIKRIDTVINQLNKLSKNINISIEKDSLKANTFIFLSTLNEIKNSSKYHQNIFKNVNENTYGYFSYMHNNNEIFQANIFIDTKRDYKFQRVVILEEITQALGLGNDSYIHDDSVFYQAKIDELKFIDKFSDIDKAIIKLLYDSQVKTGLNRIETDEILRDLL